MNRPSSKHAFGGIVAGSVILSIASATLIVLGLTKWKKITCPDVDNQNINMIKEIPLSKRPPVLITPSHLVFQNPQITLERQSLQKSPVSGHPRIAKLEDFINPTIRLSKNLEILHDVENNRMGIMPEFPESQLRGFMTFLCKDMILILDPDNQKWLVIPGNKHKEIKETILINADFPPNFIAFGDTPIKRIYFDGFAQYAFIVSDSTTYALRHVASNT